MIYIFMEIVPFDTGYAYSDTYTIVCWNSKLNIYTYDFYCEQHIY